MVDAEALAARLRANPADEAAYDQLKAVYREQGDFGSLANLIAGWAGWTPDRAAASRAYVEVGHILSSQLGELERAIEFYREAMRSDASNEDAVEALCHAYESHGALDALVPTLEEHAQWLAQTEGAVPALGFVSFRLGELWQQLGRGDLALAQYDRALQCDPGSTAALYAARMLYGERGDSQAVADLLEREVSAERDDQRRLSLLQELAGLQRQLGNRDGAIAALQQAHRIASDDHNLAYDLVSLIAERASQLDAESARADLERVADLLCEIADRLEPDQATPYLESALNYAPDHDPALSRLERILEGTAEEVQLAPHWVSYIAAAPDNRQQHRRRVKLARQYVAQGQIDDARYCLEPSARAGYAAALELYEDLPPPDDGPIEDAIGSPIDDPIDEEAAAEPYVSAEEVELEEIEDLDLVMEPNPEPPTAPAGGRARSAASLGGTRQRTSRTKKRTSPEPVTHRGGDEPRPKGPEPSSSIQTSIGEPNLIESLREATAGAVAATARSDLRERATELARDRDSAQAAALYEQIIADEPDHREAFSFLDGFYRRAQQHEKRAELLLQAGSQDKLPIKTRLTRLREAANLFETRVKDPDRAVLAWQALMPLEPQSEDAPRAIKRLLERAGRWDELAKLLELDIAQAKDEGTKVPLMRRLATIHREHRGDLAAAADTLEQILILRPDDRATRDGLIEHLLALERFEEAVPLLRDKIGESRSRSQQIGLLRQLAELFQHQLDDGERALQTYERILELSPHDLWPLDAMAALAEAAGDHERQLSTLERKADATGGAAAAELYIRMGTIAEQRLRDLDRAGGYLCRAVDLAPHNYVFLDTLCSMYEQHERYEELIRLLRERARDGRARDATVEVHRRIARVLGDKLGDDDAAAESWQDVLQLAEDPEALEALRARAAARDEPELLAEMLGRLAALEKDRERRRNLLFDRARLLTSRLNRAAEAIADLVVVMTQLDPDFEPGLAALEHASDQAGDHVGLAKVLELQLERASEAAERIAHAHKLADLYEHKLEDELKAVGALSRWAQEDESDPEPQRRLCPLFQRRRRFKELIVALDALSRLEPSAEDRRDACIRAAELAHDKFGDSKSAWRRLAPLCEGRDPVAEDATVRLAERAGLELDLYDLLEHTGSIDRLLSLLHARVELERDDDDTRAMLLRRIATVLIDYRQDEDGAAAIFKRLLSFRDDVDAMRFVQAWAIERDEIPTLSEMLRRLAALEQDPQERRDLLFEHARLLRSRLDQPAQAISVLQEVLQLQPEYQPAIEELIAACEAAEDYPTLAATLERVLDREQDRAQRVEVANRLADVYEHELSDAQGAVGALARWAHDAPADPVPSRRMRPLLKMLGRDGELLTVLDRLATNEDSIQERIDATISSARLARGRLRDPEAAWERLAPLIPHAHLEADAELHDLARQTGKLEQLYELLQGAGRYETLVQRMQEQADREPDTELRIDLLRRIARTHEDRLEDEERAEAAWSSLLELREDAEALRFIHSRALRRDDVQGVADALRRLSEIEPLSSERRDLLFEYAHVLRTRLGRATDAVAVLSGVLEQDPSFEPALDELADAAQAAGDNKTLASALSRMIEHERSPDAAVELCRRLADIYEHELRDPEATIAVLERWALTAERDPEPHHRLVPLLRKQQRHRDVVTHLDWIGTLDKSLEARAQAAIAACEAALEHFGDAEAAWTRIEPLANTGNERVELLLKQLAVEHGQLDRLIALYEAAERYDDLVVTLREEAERCEEQETRLQLYRGCARILGGTLGDEIAAAEAWREVLEIDEDAEGLRFLRELYTRLDDVEQLAPILHRLSGVANDPAEKRDLLFERALLLRDRLEQPKEAIAALHEIVALDPAFAPAVGQLVASCEAHGDSAGLAAGLERKLALTGARAGSAQIARTLADLYEGELDEPARAAAALKALCQAEPTNAEPHRRLRPYLERTENGAAELLQVLDALSAAEATAEARAEATLAAARVAFEALQDAEGAWKRLLPLALAGDDDATARAVELASAAELQRPLAGLYVMRAKRQKDPAAAAQDWMNAARVYDRALGEPSEALEACLRALANDMSDREILGEIDRLAVAADAWPRLWRVYDHVVQRETDVDGKVELLARHADLLESAAKDPGAALERVIELSKLRPDRGDILERAERLATDADSTSELLWIYESRARNAQDDRQRAHYLLRAARVSDHSLHDREQAMLYLTRTLELSKRVPEIAVEVEDAARGFDEARPELGEEDARRTLIQAHLSLAQQVGEPLGPVLVQRAAQLLSAELGDDAAAFDALKQGAVHFSNDLDLYDALEAAALRHGRLDALDAQLSRAITRSDDDAVRRELMQRRGRLLSRHLERHSKAAEVYAELLEADPGNDQVADELFSALKAAGRYQELLRAYTRRLEQATNPEQRLPLLRQIASLWEVELKNRPCALETWREIQNLAPQDREADAALSRLQETG